MSSSTEKMYHLKVRDVAKFVSELTHITDERRTQIQAAMKDLVHMKGADLSKHGSYFFPMGDYSDLDIDGNVWFDLPGKLHNVHITGKVVLRCHPSRQCEISGPKSRWSGVDFINAASIGIEGAAKGDFVVPVDVPVAIGATAKVERILNHARDGSIFGERKIIRQPPEPVCPCPTDSISRYPDGLLHQSLHEPFRPTT